MSENQSFSLAPLDKMALGEQNAFRGFKHKHKSPLITIPLRVLITSASFSWHTNKALCDEKAAQQRTFVHF